MQLKKKPTNQTNKKKLASRLNESDKKTFTWKDYQKICIIERI